MSAPSSSNRKNEFWFVFLQIFVSIFYTNIFSAILINGERNNFFPVSRGVRQGCRLSPLLYALVAESIACATRSNPLIDGYPPPGLPSGQRATLCQYVDDTSVVIIKSFLHFLLRIQERHCPHNKFTDLWLADRIFGRVTREGILTISDEFLQRT